MEKKGRRGKERRRGRGREEEEKRSKAKLRYGTNLGYEFYYGSLVCMIIILPKPRVLLGFHPKTINY